MAENAICVTGLMREAYGRTIAGRPASRNVSTSAGSVPQHVTHLDTSAHRFDTILPEATRTCEVYTKSGCRELTHAAVNGISGKTFHFNAFQ